MIPPRIGFGCAGLVLLWGLGGLMMAASLMGDCMDDKGGPCSDLTFFTPALVIGACMLALTGAILWWINRRPRDEGNAPP
jgi:hypothetical protein